jgi:copper resistance protein B
VFAGLLCGSSTHAAAADAPGIAAGLYADQLEVQHASGDSAMAWDAAAFAGRDRYRIWLRTEGERSETLGLASRLELLGGHALSPRVELVAGIRHDSGELPDRSYAALGLQSPRDARLQWDVTGYLGHGSPEHADVHGGIRLQARYGWRLASRWSLRARAEAEYWNEDHERFAAGTGSGPCELRAGLRLNYAASDAVTLYVGGELLYQLQDTAELTAAAGGDPRGGRAVLGARLTF